MKYRLLAPGPTPVPDRVLSVMNRAISHHRTPAFKLVFDQVRQGLKWLLQTESDILTLACSGTGTFEACIQNFFATKDTVICVGGGKFGERLSKMCSAFCLQVIDVVVPWGQAVNPNQVKQALEMHPHARGVFVTACETSTGVRHPFEEIGTLVSNYPECVFVVDGITGVGAFEVSPEKHNIDVLLFASQKALMVPPGLGFLAVSKKAWRAQTRANIPKFYFNLAKERDLQAKSQTAFTPAISLITGLCESLTMMQEEGLSSIFARHNRMALATRNAMKALNLAIFAASPSESVTSVCAPANIDSDAIYAGLRDYANLTIAGGQDQLKGKIFRIAHMGYFDELDIVTVLGALEIILHKCGYRDFKPGSSIGAASSVLIEGFI